MIAAEILLISADKNVAHDLYARLVKIGYKIAAVANSEDDAIAKIETSEPDLIMSDIRLEAGSGGEIKTGNLIRTKYDLPIIYITGDIGQNTIQRARPMGHHPTGRRDVPQLAPKHVG